MKKLLTNKAFLIAVSIVGIILACLMRNLFAVIPAVAGISALMRLVRTIEGQRNWTALNNALDDYEEIIGGQLWSGRDAEILASDRLDNPREPGAIRYEHICRTSSGAWFIFKVDVAMGRVLFREAHPCDDAVAKQRLERHQSAYVRCFGKPATA
jgi:hypothetical protein